MSCSVGADSGGDWKLGGMDLLAPLDGTVPDLRERGGLQPRAFRAPERNHDDWWRSSVSSWCLGVVPCVSFNVRESLGTLHAEHVPLRCRRGREIAVPCGTGCSAWRRVCTGGAAHEARW